MAQEVALSHPNIVAIHETGTEGSISFVVMELLEGETLRDLSDPPLAGVEQKLVETDIPCMERVCDAGRSMGVGPWSFDGEWTVFARHQSGRAGLWLLPAVGGELRLLLYSSDHALGAMYICR